MINFGELVLITLSSLTFNVLIHLIALSAFGILAITNFYVMVKFQVQLKENMLLRVFKVREIVNL